MNNQTQNVSVDVLKVHPRNAEFFDDISGKDYEDFKNSIKEDGIISDIIVAPDMTIISGHQRYKAAKELGISMVPIQIMENLIDEDKKLKAILTAGFGRKYNSEYKQQKHMEEYARICGINDKVESLENDIDQIKFNEEVTTTQQEMIVEAAQNRIVEIIGNDPLERTKYFRIFISRLYRDARQKAGLGSKIARTRKGNFQRCIDFIESWMPSCGSAELKAKADADARARLEARRLAINFYMNLIQKGKINDTN